MPQTKQDAQRQVDRHVTPRDCFVWFANTAKGYQPLPGVGGKPGTGCAHYVAHKQGTTRGTIHCLAGFTVRVPDLVSGLALITIDDVQVDDIWTNTNHTHCGIVVSVAHTTSGTTIAIEHCSSHHGGVFRNDWRKHFGAQGRFYRNAGRTVTTVQSPVRMAITGYPVAGAFG